MGPTFELVQHLLWMVPAGLCIHARHLPCYCREFELGTSYLWTRTAFEFYVLRSICPQDIQSPSGEGDSRGIEEVDAELSSMNYYIVSINREVCSVHEPDIVERRPIICVKHHAVSCHSYISSTRSVQSIISRL